MGGRERWVGGRDGGREGGWAALTWAAKPDILVQ